MENQISEKTKRRAFTISLIKKCSKFLKQTDKSAYTTANVKLTIQSAQVLLSVKFNTKTRNYWNCYLKEIAVGSAG